MASSSHPVDGSGSAHWTTIQVGVNDVEGVVKLRCPHESSYDGYLTQNMPPAAARVMAEWLLDGTPEKVIVLSDGRSFIEFEFSIEAIKRIASDLITAANLVEAKSLN